MEENTSNDADISDNLTESTSKSSIDKKSESSEESEESETFSYMTGSVVSDLDEIGETTENIITHLEKSLKILDEISEKKLEKHIEKAVLSEFGSMSYLQSSPFGSNKFRVKKEFKEKLSSLGVVIEDKYTFSDYCDFLTKYVINHSLTNEIGIITPDKFLCGLLEIENKPCTFIKLMGASKNVFI